MRSIALRYVTALLLSIVLLNATGLAQQPEQPSTQPETGESNDSLREQTIYIPYENLRKTFEKEGRGVFLPYEKFRKLWDAARAAEARPADQESRRAALITEIDSEASVRKDIVEVKANLQIEVLGEGWHEVPLRLADAAITESRLSGQPARLLADGKQGYRLLVENKAKAGQKLSLSLVYAKGISRAPGQNSVAFQAPQAPVNRWKVRIPEGGGEGRHPADDCRD